MSFQDDLQADISDVFLDVDSGFAVFATATGGGMVAGIFFSPYYLAEGGAASVGVGSSQPVFKVAEASASGLDQGAGLTIAGKNYEVVEPQPDGAGMVDLRLQLKTT